MEAESLSHNAAQTKRHQNARQSRFDLYMGFEEVDGGEEDPRVELPCPFCAEEFDMVGLCCHINDEHPVDSTKGVCPFCEERIGMDMLGHIMEFHGNYFKMQRRRRHRKGASVSHSMLSLLRKELREGHLQALRDGSTFATNAAADPVLSSFIYYFNEADSVEDAQPLTSDEACAPRKTADKKIAESSVPVLPDKDLEEKTRRSEFVQELVLSTLFKDVL